MPEPYIDKGLQILIDDWCIQDVKDHTKRMFKKPLNDKECFTVLESMQNEYDPEIGLSFRLMNRCVNKLFHDREKKVKP